ncbi:MAG: ribose 5-phosphate isomerase B [candidate division KSB1 bacterium]|nr:ribose 5-phosphate isomerase B [candidate division KSB1 bacterium]MDQ7063132.1 ribose 5-phosphate isomerase B [candidate division KSB1 bacterium]
MAIGADHGGFELKQILVPHLKSLGYQVQDVGTHSPDPVDYPDIAQAVAEKVAGGAVQWGIIIDGAGIGSAMVANKVPGVRAACCNDLFSAFNSREHNGANVLTLGGRIIGDALAKKIVETWLSTHFGGGRHQRRLEKMMAIEAKYRQFG